MASFYVNSYAPLVSTADGRYACERHHFPPFVDYSIRREPDLEHEHPAISCVCRGKNFAPRLEAGDVVAYMTMKRRYGSKTPHRRLTAVLRVVETFPTHRDGAWWYAERGLGVPSNCLVPNNPPYRLQESAGACGSKKKGGCGRPSWKEWDELYQERCRQHGAFVVCDVLFRKLSWSAPVITDEALIGVFGRLPPTRNPKTWPISYWQKFQREMRLPVELTSP
jgi:hypothetical protein